MSIFLVHCELDAFEKSGGDPANRMRIGGIVSTDQLDKQGERVVQEGLDFSPFLATGWFNDNHGQESTDVVGYPTDARFVRKGDRLPNGKAAETSGWWAEGYLLDTDKGRKLWDLARSLNKSPRRLGFSIEGRVLQRASRDASKVTRAVVKNVALTHCPVAFGTALETLSKALMAGSAVGDPGAAPGEGFPLRTESLDGVDDHGVGSGAQRKRRARVDTTVVADPTDDAPGDEGAVDAPKQLAKAEDAPDDAIDELAMLAAWAPALSRGVERCCASSKRMTKAEARIVVRSMKPGMPESQVNEIVNRATR